MTFFQLFLNLIFTQTVETYQPMTPETLKPSLSNEICQKCGFCFHSPQLDPTALEFDFTQGVYLNEEGELVMGIPEFTPEGGWIVYIGEVPDRTIDQDLGILAERGFRDVANGLVEVGQIDRVWYHPATKCRPLIERQIPDQDNPKVRNKVIAPPKKLSVTQYQKCWNFIWPDIKAVKPSAFILGSHAACKMVLGSGALNSMQGKRYLVDINLDGKEVSIPTFPVINQENVRQDDRLRWPDFIQELKTIFHKIDNPMSFDFVDVDGWMDFVWGLTIDRVKDWFRPIWEKTGYLYPLSWDVETCSVDYLWGAHFKVGIFSFDSPLQEKPLIVVTSDYKYAKEAFEKFAPEAERSFEQEEADILKELQKVLEEPSIRKIGHNTSFDEKAVYSRYKWNVKGFLADTRIIDYILNAEQQGGRTLNDLIRRELQWLPEYWKVMDKFREENPDLGYNYVDYPIDLVIPYAAYDTKTVSMIYEKVLKKLIDAAEEDFGGEFPISDGDNISAPTYSLFQYHFFARRIHYQLCNHLGKVGQYIDKELLGKVSEIYENDLAEMQRDLREDPLVQQFEWTWLLRCYKSDSQNARKLVKHLEPVQRMVSVRHGKPVAEDEVPPPLDWNRDKDILMSEEFVQYRPTMSWGSPNQVQMLFYEFMGLEPPGYTDADNPSTDHAALVSLASRQECKLADKLLKYRATEKFLSGFIRPFASEEDSLIKAENLVHADFLPAHPRTGRLSCKAPNIQQLPRDGLVKKLYCSRFTDNPGRTKRGWIIQRDYSGLEVRVLACLSRDERLVDDFLNGRDPHFRTQRKFFGELADKHNKNQRSICKNVLFGRLYGQTAYGLLFLLRGRGIKSPFTGEEITLQECELLNQMIDDLYEGVAEWVNNAHAQGILKKHVCSPFGFVRPLPVLKSWQRYMEGIENYDKSRSFGFLKSEIKAALRKAQNSPIQSSASDLTVFAGWEVKKRIDAAGIKAEVIALVHDSIWVDCALDSDVSRVIKIMKDVMDFAPEWLPNCLPGFDPSWMIVPIIGESEFGLNAKDTFTSCEEPSSYHPDDKLVVEVANDFLSENAVANLVGVDKSNEKWWKVPFDDNLPILKKALHAKKNAF